MRWIIRSYTLVLLAYTGWRTTDFMMNQLPSGNFSFWLAIFFLFAAEVGLAIWHEVSINHTSTYTQHYLATSLTWLDFTGSLGAGIADMIIRQTLLADYQIPPMLATGLIYGLPVIVAINVAGALIYLANDADLVEERERKFLDFEAYKQASRDLKASKNRLVASKKKELYAKITGSDLDDVQGTGKPSAGKGKSASKDAPASNGLGVLDEAKELLAKANPTRRRKSRQD